MPHGSLSSSRSAFFRPCGLGQVYSESRQTAGLPLSAVASLGWKSHRPQHVRGRDAPQNAQNSSKNGAPQQLLGRGTLRLGLRYLLEVELLPELQRARAPLRLLSPAMPRHLFLFIFPSFPIIFLSLFLTFKTSSSEDMPAAAASARRPWRARPRYSTNGTEAASAGSSGAVAARGPGAEKPLKGDDISITLIKKDKFFKTNV